jgi:hypothetical protein
LIGVRRRIREIFFIPLSTEDERRMKKEKIINRNKTIFDGEKKTYLLYGKKRKIWSGGDGGGGGSSSSSSSSEIFFIGLSTEGMRKEGKR